MFDPFFTRKVGGTGLGLAVVYGVVAQSGGHLRVVSEQGRGTTFWAMFPHANRPAESDSSGRNGPRLSVVRRRTVLLVEDQEAVRASVHHMLTILGHDVLDAAGGDEALVLCRGTSAPPDLLVTDVVMPGLRGPEVAAAVRELVPGIGVVFMSGFIEREADDEIVRDAHAVFVAKPFTLEELRATLAAALSRRVRTG